jgi:N-ethylmaleimide reductase
VSAIVRVVEAQMTADAAVLRPDIKHVELLFEPMRLGRMTLPHRIAMAPLTRSRARQPGNVPKPLNASYYVQRASAAVIISEATQVSMQGQGYAWTPGIHSREQIEGWRLVSDAVHAAGGRIFLQLWHVGRISHPALQPDKPVAPSARCRCRNTVTPYARARHGLVSGHLAGARRGGLTPPRVSAR